MAKSAKKVLTMSGYSNVKLDLEPLKPSDQKCAFDQGCGIILFAKLKSGAILGADSLGRIDKTAERVGEDAAHLIINELKKRSPVDSHLADQIIMYMGLAEGESRIRITNLSLHTLTSIEICERILGIKYAVKKGIDKTAEIKCSGIALKNKFK
jgi:RNA 3'-terminal phosphate cyclase (ATP)